MLTVFFTIFTVGFCTSGALFSIFKYYKSPKNSFFLFFSIVCFFMCFRVLSLSELSVALHLNSFKSGIAGLLIISFYIFIYFLFEEVEKLLKISLLIGSVFFTVYILIELFNFEKVNFMFKYLGKYVDTIEVAIIGFFIFRKKQKYMRFIQYGVILLFIIALLVYIPRITNSSFKIPQSILIQIEAILGICLFQFSTIIKEKGLEEDKLRIETKVMLLENQIKCKIVKDYIYCKNLKINIKKLKYIQSEGHYIKIFTEGKKEFVRGKISEILKKLPSNFISVHRSYIVNINYISSFNNKNITLITKEVIPVSRSKKNQIKTELDKRITN